MPIKRTPAPRPHLRSLALRFAAGCLAVAAGNAQAQDFDQLVRHSNCLACHHTTQRVVGPSFSDVALRYRGNPEAAPMLATRLRKGTRGNWGATPMPASPQLTPEEALQLSEWVLSRAESR